MSVLPRIKETRILKLVPSTREREKVSVDDGFTAIPNELLFALGKFGFTQRQFNLLIAVIQKTLSWHKEMDWISNSQICELVDLPDEQKASKTKQELMRMNVLIQQGKKIGLNLIVSEWEKVDCTKGANIAQKMQKNLHKSCNSHCTKDANTKETITKQKINNPPLPPQGESANAEQQATGSAEEIKPSKPKNLPVDYQGVMEEFNLAVADTPISQIRVMSEQRKRTVHSLAKLIKQQFGCYTREAFGDYFRDFVEQANARRDRFYFGGLDGSKWVADFDYILRTKTFAKTVENSL